jgi:hypothetical protein
MNDIIASIFAPGLSMIFTAICLGIVNRISNRQSEIHNDVDENTRICKLILRLLDEHESGRIARAQFKEKSDHATEE